MRDGEGFSKLIEEFGTTNIKEEEEEEESEEVSPELVKEKTKRSETQVAAKLMQEEERETGSISWSVCEWHLSFLPSPTSRILH